MDSLRQDHISYYNENKRVFHGVPVTKTPNLDKLALDGITFKNAYPSGLPTIPQRTELMTGQFTLPYKAWSPLNTSDLTLAAFLKRRGYITSLVSDTYHMFKPGYNFYSYLDYWEFIRGQEFDQHGLPPPKNRNANDYSNENIRKDSSWMALINKFLSNIDEFATKGKRIGFPARFFQGERACYRVKAIKNYSCG
jgi:arylsulfatase A-like enzyme